MKLCTECNKNVAVIFLSKMEHGQPKSEALCIECAHKKQIPGIDQMIKDTGMSLDQIKNMTAGMNDILGDMDEFESPEEMMKMLMESQGIESEEDFDSELDDEEPPIVEETTFEDNTSEEKPKKKKKKKDKKKKNLDTYGTNLTQKARDNEVDRIIGRNREIDRVVQILNRRSKNNPVLIGEAGVGKTAIAEGLAVRVAQKQVPAKLFNMDIYLLDMTAIVAGTHFRRWSRFCVVFK